MSKTPRRRTPRAIGYKQQIDEAKDNDTNTNLNVVRQPQIRYDMNHPFQVLGAFIANQDASTQLTPVANKMRTDALMTKFAQHFKRSEQQLQHNAQLWGDVDKLMKLLKEKQFPLNLRLTTAVGELQANAGKNHADLLTLANSVKACFAQHTQKIDANAAHQLRESNAKHVATKKDIAAVRQTITEQAVSTKTLDEKLLEQQKLIEIKFKEQKQWIEVKLNETLIESLIHTN